MQLDKLLRGRPRFPRRRRKSRRPGGGSIRRRRSIGESEGGESQSDMEVEHESEEPTEMGDDTSALEDEGVRGAVVTSVEHCEPAAASIGGECDVETRDDVPELRKCAVSEDTALE